MLRSALATAVLAVALGPLPAPAQWLTAPVADHHMHLRTPEMLQTLRAAQEAVGQRVVEDDGRPLTAADALAVLDSAGVARGVVLSTAYLYAMPELAVAGELERARVQAENDFVSREVMRHPDRLTGFCSANPLSSYALDELRRCAALPGIAGYKLHFGNSDVDLHDPSHLERLRAVFGLAGELGMALAVHMRTRNPEYGAEDARVFIRELLPLAGEVPVQIAHMGGGGMYDDATDAALGAFTDAIRSGELTHPGLVFDLAAVVAPISRAATAGPALVPRVRLGQDRLVTRIRELGPERVVYGTDWDALPLPAYLATVQLVLPLTRSELDTILANRAPYLR